MTGGQRRRDSASAPSFAAVLGATMAVGPLLHYSLSAIGPVLIQDLGISRAQLGLFATATFLAAASTSWLGGRFVDRQPEGRVIILLYGLATSALILAAALRSFQGVLIGAAISGVAQALANPVTNSMISSRPSYDRGVLVGIKQSGVQVAQLVAGVALPSLAVALTWPGALAATAVAVVLLLPAILLFVRSNQAPIAIAPSSTATGVDRHLVRACAGYSFLSGAAIQATNAYLPLYAYEAIRLSVTTAGLTAAVVGGIGLISRPVWGRVAQRASSLRGLLTMMALVSAGGNGLLLLATGRSPWPLWLGSSVHGAVAVAANVVVMVALLRRTATEHIGRSTGLVGLGMFLGFALGPSAFGWLSDQTTTYTSGWWFAIAAHAVAALWVFVGMGRSSDAGVRSGPRDAAYAKWE